MMEGIVVFIAESLDTWRENVPTKCVVNQGTEAMGVVLVVG
jgi:hypothetical protein